MNTHETPKTRRLLTIVTVAAVSLVFVVLGVAAQEDDGVHSSGLFELGDGVDPAVPGVANIGGELLQQGPDWGDLFNADGGAVDEVDGQGNPGSDGIPDFRQLHGGEWAVLIADDISLGVGLESTALHPDGRVYNATASADHDLGNAYLYSTVDAGGNLVLYAAMERLGGGESHLEIEFNQSRIRLGHGGYGRGEPWQLVGDRVDGDLLVRLSFDNGALDVVEASTWSEQAWIAVPLGSISGEGCNAAETLCAICNAVGIDGGPWKNFDTADDPEQISRNRFVEVGIHAGALLGAQPDFATVQMRTPEDIAFGYFAEGS